MSISANGVKAAASYGPWSIAHRDAVTRPIVDSFVNAVKADGAAKKIVLVGTCFGGRHALLSGGAGSVVDAVVSFHPAGVTPSTELTALTVPTSIIVGDEDDLMPVAQIDEAKAIFKEASEKNGSKGLEVNVLPKVSGAHLRSARVDSSHD